MRTEEACRSSYEEVVARLATDVQRGLSWREADRRLLMHGKNEFEVKIEDPLWKKYIEQVIILRIPLKH